MALSFTNNYLLISIILHDCSQYLIIFMCILLVSQELMFCVRSCGNLWKCQTCIASLWHYDIGFICQRTMNYTYSKIFFCTVFIFAFFNTIYDPASSICIQECNQTIHGLTLSSSFWPVVSWLLPWQELLPGLQGKIFISPKLWTHWTCADLSTWIVMSSEKLSPRTIILSILRKIESDGATKFIFSARYLIH